MRHMQKDILFKQEDWVFSYRVAGVLERGGRLLLQKPVDDDGYAFIGGHVAAFETSRETLRREFLEEIHAHIEVQELMAVGEIFFPWGKRPCHQISLYYRVRLEDEGEIPLEGVFHGFDDLGGERINLDFCWVPMEQLRSVAAYPQELTAHLLEGRKDFLHFVSRQMT